MPYRLLLADDSLTIQKVVELVLANENFEIKAVNDGETAYSLVDSFNPHIILADIDMPQLNGYQLCQKVKSSPATAHIPVILLAGAFEPFDEEYAKEVNADDSIIKPFESQELISKVKALIADSIVPAAETETPASAEDAYELGEDMQETEPATIDELKWDSEVADLTAEAHEQDEASVADVAYAEQDEDFRDVLSEVMRSRKSEGDEEAGSADEPIAVFSRASSGISEEVDKSISAAMQSDIIPQISQSVKEAVEKVVASSAPEIITNVSRELVIDLLPGLKASIEDEIRRAIPEIAEKIINKEIEKITSGT
ncbi:MAG: response regulator [Nitrospiraceae bacterium]|nr:response regulator [Nitrospiraceae bacterium]